MFWSAFLGALIPVIPTLVAVLVTWLKAKQAALDAQASKDQAGKAAVWASNAFEHSVGNRAILEARLPEKEVPQ